MRFCVFFILRFAVIFGLVFSGMQSVASAELISATAKKIGSGKYRVTAKYNYDISNKKDIIHNIQIYAGGRRVCEIINSTKTTLFKKGPHTYGVNCMGIPSSATKLDIKVRTLGFGTGGKRKMSIPIN